MSDLENDAGAQPEEESKEAPAPAKNEALAAEIEAWFVRSFHDSVVSRHTDAFNHVRASVDALKKQLAG